VKIKKVTHDKPQICRSFRQAPHKPGAFTADRQDRMREQITRGIDGVTRGTA
jgi:hypothetical protein